MALLTFHLYPPPPDWSILHLPLVCPAPWCWPLWMSSLEFPCLLPSVEFPEWDEREVWVFILPALFFGVQCCYYFSITPAPIRTLSLGTTLWSASRSLPEPSAPQTWSCFAIPRMLYCPLLSALNSAYTLVIRPLVNALDYFECTVYFLDSE